MPGGTARGTVKERGEKNGAVFFIMDTPGGVNKTAKIWVNKDYKGDVPGPGGSGSATFDLQPSGDYELKKLVSWEGTLGAVNSNGSEAPSSDQRFVGREPGLYDHWTEHGRALTLAVDIRGSGLKLEEYWELKEEIFQRLWQDAEKTHGGKPEAKADDWS